MSDAAPRPDAAPRQRPRSASQTMRFRAGALAALAVVIGLVLWLALRDTGGSSSTSTSSGTTIVSATADEIGSLATTVGHPVFWLGAKKGYTYELRREPNGTIVIRYLPAGENVGSSKPYLSVATYPFANAYGALKALETKRGSSAVSLPGGFALVFAKFPNNVHLAYPGVNYQGEVFDPTPGVAKRLVEHGRLVVMGEVNAAPSSANGVQRSAIDVAGLQALVTRLGHPVYWAGPKPRYTYEVGQGPSGEVFVRYLPKGVQVGSTQPYLTVATYPLKGAFRATQSLTSLAGASTIELSGGGLAVIDPQHPTNIHLAYPSSDYQVEVYDPSSRVARAVVASGQVKTIG